MSNINTLGLSTYLETVENLSPLKLYPCRPAETLTSDPLRPSYMVSMLHLLVTNRTLGDNANAVMVFWGYFCDYCCRIELNVFSLAMSSLARLIVPTLL